MGAGSVDLLVTLQILPGFFSNCLFLALYDSVVLVKRLVSLLSCSGSGGGEWQRMLTSAGLRSIWNSFLLDAYKQRVEYMDNNANVAYGVSNERVCIVQRRKIAYLGGKGPFFYNLKDVRQYLEQSYGKRSDQTERKRCL